MLGQVALGLEREGAIPARVGTQVRVGLGMFLQRHINSLIDTLTHKNVPQLSDLGRMPNSVSKGFDLDMRTISL